MERNGEEQNEISLKEHLKSRTLSFYQKRVLNHLEIIITLSAPPLPQSPFRVREGRFRLKEIVFYNSFIYLYNIIEILIMKFFLNLQILERSDRGGYRGGEHSPPPEFGIFCSYFQNSFSITCLRERNPSAKQEKYLS